MRALRPTRLIWFAPSNWRILPAGAITIPARAHFLLSARAVAAEAPAAEAPAAVQRTQTSSPTRHRPVAAERPVERFGSMILCQLAELEGLMAAIRGLGSTIRRHSPAASRINPPAHLDRTSIISIGPAR